MTRRRLETVRWTLILLVFVAIVASWVVQPKGGWATLLFFFFVVTGIPAAMLSLHLHPPKFLKFLERRKP